MSTTYPDNPRPEYVSDGAIAIIGHWRDDPMHPEHLVRLAHIYEDEDDPESLLTVPEMEELVSIFTDAARWYVRNGVHDMDGALIAQAKYLREQIAIKRGA